MFSISFSQRCSPGLAPTALPQSGSIIIVWRTVTIQDLVLDFQQMRGELDMNQYVPFLGQRYSVDPNTGECVTYLRTNGPYNARQFDRNPVVTPVVTPRAVTPMTGVTENAPTEE